MRQKGFIPIIILVLVILAAVGYFGYKNYWPKAQTLVITSPTPAPTPDPTADWKTYTTQFYSFKYPPQWQAQKSYTYDSGSETGFEYDYGYPFYVRHIGNYNQLTSKPYSSLQEYLGSRSGSIKDIQIDSFPAKHVSNPGDEGRVVPYEEVLVFVPNRTFILSLYYQLYDKADIKTFDQILSTFKFTK